jgi:hypothetical protein
MTHSPAQPPVVFRLSCHVTDASIVQINVGSIVIREFSIVFFFRAPRASVRITRYTTSWGLKEWGSGGVRVVLSRPVRILLRVSLAGYMRPHHHEGQAEDERGYRDEQAE